MFAAIPPHSAVAPITGLGLILLKNLSLVFESDKFTLLLVAPMCLRLFIAKFLHITDPAKSFLSKTKQSLKI